MITVYDFYISSYNHEGTIGNVTTDLFVNDRRYRINMRCEINEDMEDLSVLEHLSQYDKLSLTNGMIILNKQHTKEVVKYELTKDYVHCLINDIAGFMINDLKDQIGTGY